MFSMKVVQFGNRPVLESTSLESGPVLKPSSLEMSPVVKSSRVEVVQF